MNLLRCEQETIVNYNAGETTAIVYTRDKTVMRRLDALVADFPEQYQLIGVTDIDKTYQMPKSHVIYRKPRRVSSEHREQARQQMKKINNRRYETEVNAHGSDIRICKSKQSGAKRGSADDSPSGDGRAGGKHIR